MKTASTIVLALAACVADTGPSGAPGAAGARGPQGAQGPAGPQGAPGPAPTGPYIQNQTAAPQPASFWIEGDAVVRGGHAVAGGDGHVITTSGSVTVVDKTAVDGYLAGTLQPTMQQLLHGDVDGDGLVTRLDGDLLDALIVSRPLAAVQTEGRRLVARARYGVTRGSGDANLDGSTNASDASLLASYLSGTTTLTSTARLNADVNADGRVDRLDFEAISQLFLTSGAEPTFEQARRASDTAFGANLAGYPMITKHVTAPPPAGDCTGSVRGAMALDPQHAYLYLCGDAGWKKMVLE